MNFLFSLILVLFSWGIGAFQAGAGEENILIVDNFSKGTSAEGIPPGWILEKEPKSDSKIAVEGEKGKTFLHLRSAGDAFGLKKEMSFDIRNYPYLSWKWRVTELPKGGDIRTRDTDDQAGQIYVIFPRFPAKVNSLSVGYIWDTLAPAGLSGTSTAYGKMKYVVLQSGAAKLNQWVLETRNVFEDFKKLFQDEPPKAGGILLYVNSQHTKTSCACDYADIFFSAHPPEAK